MPHVFLLRPRTSACAVALAALQGLSLAQSGPVFETPSRDDMYFSITWRGPSIGLMSGPNTVTSGDILQPEAPGTALAAPAPKIFLPAAAIGLEGLCDEVPGLPCAQELDALSFGFDAKLGRAASPTGGHPLLGGPPRRGHHRLRSSSRACGPRPSSTTTAPTSWRRTGPAPPTPADPMAVGHNFISIDGNGVAASSGLGAERPGSGLVEPNDPSTGWPMNIHDRGDELDALDLGTPREHTQGRFYFSVQGGGIDVFDPIGTPPVPDTAGLERVSPADVLMGRRGAPHRLYARSRMLGLDPQRDDIDALIIGENGQPGYQMPPRPFEWSSQAHDMVIFSVRRGSAIIGTPDSALGLPITEGDLLTAPGPMGGPPAIVATAESLGLRAERGGDPGGERRARRGHGGQVRLPRLQRQPRGRPHRHRLRGELRRRTTTASPTSASTRAASFGSCPDGSSPICANLDFWAGCENGTGVGGGLHCLGAGGRPGRVPVLRHAPAGVAAGGSVHSDGSAPVPAALGNGLLFPRRFAHRRQWTDEHLMGRHAPDGRRHPVHAGRRRADSGPILVLPAGLP